MMKRGKVYVWPTKMGAYFNALIFLMFLLSVGYSNNLLLIFTLTLFAFNLIWVIQTHYHLNKLSVEHIHLSDGHAGTDQSFWVGFNHSPKLPHEWKLKLVSQSHDSKLSPIEFTQDKTTGQFICQKRGYFQYNYLKVITDRPFGLYIVWKYFPVKSYHFVYPSLKKELSVFDPFSLGLEGEMPTGMKGSGDIQGLANYDGHGMKRISWKHYARTGDVLIKEREAMSAQVMEFTLPNKESDIEEKLSILATQLVHCYRESIPFSLRTPKKMMGPSLHKAHLEECLKELALC